MTTAPTAWLLRHVRLPGCFAQAGVFVRRHAGAYCPSIHSQPDARGVPAPLRRSRAVRLGLRYTDDHIGIVASNDAAAKKIAKLMRETPRAEGWLRGRARLLNDLRRHPPGLRRPGLHWRTCSRNRALVLKVVNGDHGNDPERAGAPEARGYDYEAVRGAAAPATCAASPSAPPSRLRPLRAMRIITPSGVNVREGAGKRYAAKKGLPDGHDRDRDADSERGRKPK